MPALGKRNLSPPPKSLKASRRQACQPITTVKCYRYWDKTQGWTPGSEGRRNGWRRLPGREAQTEP